MLSIIFATWPGPQIRALRLLLDSPRTIWAAMEMAYHEMQGIKEPDVPLLMSNRDRLYFYFAEQDDWVGRYRDDILKSFEPDRRAKVVQGQRDIPHVFCISITIQPGLCEISKRFLKSKRVF
ncbi:hypothetical protein AX15_001566 [Amanita polypyramis BW_CC]|nr:hypothetical protein AX15_001566 [Amanita polypyramis BW_CC]